MTLFAGPKSPGHADHTDPPLEHSASRRASDRAVERPQRSAVANPPFDDAALLEAIRTGDEEAFATIFRRHATPSIQYASRIVSSDVVAQDIVMDVFMRLWRGRLALPPDTNLGAYVRASVRNSCMNYLRHHRIEASIEAMGAASGWAPAMSVAPLMPDEDLERIEAKEIVRHALTALSPRLRLVLEMRWLGEKSYKEIATELGMQVRSVETSVARAMRILRERMMGNDTG